MVIFTLKKTMKKSILALAFNLLFFLSYAQWNSVGLGTDLSVYDLEEYAGELWAGGNFKNAGGTAAAHIAKWNGTSWSSPVSIDSVVWAVTKIGNDLYVGGSFRNVLTTSGNITANKIVKFDGTSWVALGTGIDDHEVLAITEYKGEIYVGGTFDFVNGGTPAKGIAKWNGSAFIPVNIPLNGYVTSLKVYNNELYIGGDFTHAGTTQVNHIVKWDGTSYYTVSNGFNNWVWDLTIHNSELYAGGVFTYSGSNQIDYVAKLSSGNWLQLDTLPINAMGPFDGIYALHSFGNELYAGGIFSTKGGLHDIVRLNANVWVDAALGMASSPAVGVMSLDSYSNNLYSAGLFTSPFGFIAQWNPVSMNIQEISHNELLVFPNPSNGLINVSINNPANGVLKITDMQGRLIYTSALKPNQFNESNTLISVNLSSILDASGFYLVIFTSENTSYHTKVCYNK